MRKLIELSPASLSVDPPNLAAVSRRRPSSDGNLPFVTVQVVDSMELFIRSGVLLARTQFISVKR